MVSELRHESIHSENQGRCLPRARERVFQQQRDISSGAKGACLSGARSESPDHRWTAGYSYLQELLGHAWHLLYVSTVEPLTCRACVGKVATAGTRAHITVVHTQSE